MTLPGNSASACRICEERSGLIAADPVQRLGQQNVELTVLGIAHQPLDARTQDRTGPGDRASS